MKSSKKFLALLVLSVLVFSVGCISQNYQTGTTSKVTTKSSTTQGIQEQKPETTTSKAKYPITLTDLAGRTVTIEKPPERVVVLSSYWAEILCILGVQDKIVGIGKYIPYDPYIPDDVKKKTVVGSTFKGLNWETVASLNPDLIIVDWYGGKYKDAETIKKAEELGIPVIALSAKSVGDNIKVVELLGKVLGKEEKAEELASWMKEKLDEVNKIASQIPADKKNNVLLISAPKDIGGPITVYAKGSAWASMVELVGAHNLAFDKEFDTPWPKLDLEKIIAYWGDKADVIIVVSFSQKKLDKVINGIKNDPRWREIKAVKEGHVYGILAGSKGFLDWGPRIVVGVYQMGGLIYPEYYPKWQKLADELLQQFYGESFYKTIRDSLGREVKIPKRGVRAVVLNSYYELIIYALGAYDHVVGVGKYHWKNPTIQVLMEKGKIPKDMPNLGSLWSGVDLEMLEALNPDCVIVWAYGKADIDKIQHIEEATGIPVIAIDFKTIDDFYNGIKLFGEIFNKEEEAKEIVNSVKEEIEEVTSRTSEISDEKVRVFLTYEIKDNMMVSEGKGGINTQILQMINAIPVTENFSQKYPKVSLEQLYTLNPDVIILFYRHMKEPSPESLYNDPAWQDLKAVKERKICDLRGYVEKGFGGWEPAGIPLRIIALAECCYPDKLKDIDFNATAERLFNKFYGISYREMKR